MSNKTLTHGPTHPTHTQTHPPTHGFRILSQFA